MTIAICLKVGDGVVLGADSASTIPGAIGFPEKVYFNAEKISNLVKGLPVGAMVYGLGGFAGRSVTSLTKDLRQRLSGHDPAHADWALDPREYTIEEVARRYTQFFYDELYRSEFFEVTDAPRPTFGAIVAGFSAGNGSAEIWTIEVGPDGSCIGPTMAFGPEQHHAIIWRGMGEPLFRLIRGWSMETLEWLIASGMREEEAIRALDAVAPLFSPAMPIQDAIDLVEYLVHVTCGYYRFHPGYPTVAPPIDLAAITRHEGFRWVRRKHYYEARLNPEPQPHERLITPTREGT